ncbi:MAG: hypothetical protein ACRCXZ_07065 [Patescibacteria group bacterium]
MVLHNTQEQIAYQQAQKELDFANKDDCKFSESYLINTKINKWQKTSNNLASGGGNQKQSDYDS